MRWILFLISNFVLFSGHMPGQTVQLYYRFDDFQEWLERDDHKTYVINFWATWCAPCIREMPYFEQLNDKYKNDDVEVILVSLDFRSLYEKQVIPFVEKKNLRSKVLMLADPKANDWIDKVDPSWSGAIPATLIYNKSSRLFIEKEFHSLEEVEEALKNVTEI